MGDEAVGEAVARVVANLPGGGEARPGQLEMAQAAYRAMTERRHLVVQAGTGTGKSLAYLIPAILSGKKVVVSTATKALQDQLAGKDLPFLQEHLGLKFEFSVMKGRSNYLCRQRMREVAGGDDQMSLDEAEAGDLGGLGQEVLRLLRWGAETETGDRAELDFEPRPRAWSAVSVTAMECPGAANCPSGEQCFAEVSRQRAEVADVVVVNTHLYGAHLASGGYVLPEHDVVVFDEAHELEDIAAASLGIELGAGRFRALARNARAIAKDRSAIDDLETAGDILERALTEWNGRRLPEGLGDEMQALLALIAQRVSAATASIRGGQGDEARKGRALQAAGHLSGDLAFVQAAKSTDVVWVEGGPRSPVLRVAPVDVSAALAERLWGEIEAVLTSATIPAHLATRVGLPPDRVDQLDVGSPFHYDEAALLYCAAHLPDPRSPAYEAAMLDELKALLRAAGGRSLVLFTSWRAVQAASDALAAEEDLAFTVLSQSDLPKPALIEAFSTDETSCLLATMGFWQGVDVPGRALTQVIIDRIPFPRPDEPLLQARRDKAGPAAFRIIDLPRAATLLAQGAGRLIRNTTDRGVVAVLDPRLASANYRWDLVNALPPMRRTRNRSDVEAFLATHLAHP